MKNTIRLLSILSIAATIVSGCSNKDSRISVIFDTDANNELDDQHAIAYMLMNPETFNVLGITTNATYAGGPVALHSEEAGRIVALSGRYGEGIEVIDGADGTYEEILPHISEREFDGSKAVDFIIDNARNFTPESKLTLIAVGKLTNEALALAKAPEIARNLRIVWLGTNYPENGEYNLEGDIPSMNAILDADVEFEIATVRYGMDNPEGTDKVVVTEEEVIEHFAGKGPQVSPVAGRHGGEFTCFGDYSLDLFRHITHNYGGRALYDMATVAIVKNPDWAESLSIPAPTMVDSSWVERPDNSRHILLWENFDRDAIINDFIATLEKE